MGGRTSGGRRKLKLRILAVGRDKGPTRALHDDYVARLPWPSELREFAESKQRSIDARMAEEAQALSAAIPAGARLMALDRTGEMLDSPAFAKLLGRWRDDGARDIAFLIGGPDGLLPALAQKCDKRLSFGAMTWPHLLARAMLAEQLWRAAAILGNHPYHR